MMMRLVETLNILVAFYGKRWTLARLRTKAHVERRQKKLLVKLQAHAVQHFPFYKGMQDVPFQQWPILDKASAVHHFGALNAHGLSREDAWALAERGLRDANSSTQWHGLTIGTSTGTSGQRGLFMVSTAERSLWLGAILARCLPDFPVVKHRVAVMLATGNNLYDTANASQRLRLQFFDLKQGLEIHVAQLERFSPDVLIAPPKAVAALATAKIGIRPTQIFTGGEVLDPLEAYEITQWFGIAPRSIYQATEGFFGVACTHGHIHLNEDDLIFEQESVAGHPNHFVPVITDLRRRAQAMIRYRLNDVLVKLDGSCPCGSPLLALARVEGRCDDILNVEGTTIMPDAVRAVILDADRRITDFRLIQTSSRGFELRLAKGTPLAAAKQVQMVLTKYLESLIGKVEVKVTFGIHEDPAKKLRRIISEMT